MKTALYEAGEIARKNLENVPQWMVEATDQYLNSFVPGIRESDQDS
jgi:hypothetical protein